MKIKINPALPVPARRQIVQRIADQVRKGKLLSGDPLPDSAALSRQLRLPAADVDEAYHLLARDKMIERDENEGVWTVSTHQNVMGPGRKEQALALINRTIERLKKLKFSYREMRTLIELQIMDKEARMETLQVAGIDCTPETLSALEQHIGGLIHAKPARFLLDDLRAGDQPERQLAPFDLILTTPAHETEVRQMLPGLVDKIALVILSPDQAGIMEMAGLNTAQRIGIICESDSFQRLIRNKLKDIGFPDSHIAHLFVENEEQLPDFLQHRDVVLTPPGYSLLKRREHAAAVQAFRQRGGNVIPLDYQLERNALWQLEERVRQALET